MTPELEIKLKKAFLEWRQKTAENQNRFLRGVITYKECVNFDLDNINHCSNIMFSLIHQESNW